MPRPRRAPRLAGIGGALVLAALAGCGGAPRSTAPIPGLGQGDGEAAWAGTLSCVDCEGIDTRLILQRQGGKGRYRLLETYLSGDGDLDYAEQGSWEQVRAGVLLLRGDRGGQRLFGVVEGGALQLRDALEGSRSGRDDDILTPVPAAP